MELLTYRFSKEKNSTKQPGTPLHTYDVKLKNETTIMNPVFEVDGIDLTVNYCKWNGRYYFINDISLRNNNIYELRCTLDVLASWKTSILGTTQYVLRSASQHDGDISDSYYPAKSIWDYVDTTLENAPRSNNIHFVVGIINGVAGYKLGSVMYYYLTGAQCQTLLNYLMNDTSYFNIPDEIMDPNLQKAQINPIQYIVSCIAVPDYVGTFPIFQSVPMRVGWWDVPNMGNVSALGSLSASISRVTTADFTMALPHHPDIEDRESPYFDFAPWTNRTFYWEPYGTIQLDTSELYDCGNINIHESIDLITGVSELIISGSKSGAHKQIAYATAQLGARMLLSQMVVDHLAQTKVAINSTAGAINNALSTGASLVSGDILGGIKSATNLIAGASNGILDMKQASAPKLEKSGANNSIAAFGRKPHIYSQFIRPVDDDNTHLGRPLCKDVTLSTLSGFTLCRDADIQLQCLADETEMIKAYLNSGFYIE